MTLQDYLTKRAITLEEAWSRFDPQTPLPVGSPFYIEREDNPLGRLKRGLLLAQGAPPKYFFAGHRGCGKSTELNRLVADPEIHQRYWPVKFSIRDECDFNDLSHIEVLLTIGAQLFRQYTEKGGRIRENLLHELEEWKGRTIERLQSKGAAFEGGAGFDVGEFFLKALLKVKTEHATRVIVRQEIGPRLSELIEIINLISAEVQARTGKHALVIVEDMDKPALDIARKLFEEAFTNLTQPLCAMVYTVPVAIYFDPTFSQIRETSYFLPNVKLHAKGRREETYMSGQRAMRAFALARMKETLITPNALDAAVQLSGGVFREMAHLLQRAIDNALAREAEAIEPVDVQWAAAQIRSAFRRLLKDQDYQRLLEVRATNEMHHPEQLSPLLHLLAVLEYSNGENWCNVHPALDPLLDEIAPSLTAAETPDAIR